MAEKYLSEFYTYQEAATSADPIAVDAEPVEISISSPITPWREG